MKASGRLSHCLNAGKGCVMWGFGGVKQCECPCDICMEPFVYKSKQEADPEAVAQKTEKT